MNRLIINADDFGIHPAVNQAIVDAHRRGVLTSTSLLATGPAFADAVALACQNPNLGIGIHLCLVGGLPSMLPRDKVSTLVDADGRFPESYVPFIKKAYTGDIDFTQVYDELDAQIKAILATGLPVTHEFIAQQ